LLFNLLEHIYNPILALENSLHLVASGGAVVIAGPTVLQLHDYPRDYWRPMPDFFLEFADRHSLEIPSETLMWLTNGEVFSLDRFSRGSQKQLPSYSRPGVFQVWGKRRAYWSRGIHKLFATFGEETPYPSSGLGVVLRKPVVPST
jgi:hypothetical protein